VPKTANLEQKCARSAGPKGTRTRRRRRSEHTALPVPVSIGMLRQKRLESGLTEELPSWRPFSMLVVDMFSFWFVLFCLPV